MTWFHLSQGIGIHGFERVGTDIYQVRFTMVLFNQCVSFKIQNIFFQILWKFHTWYVIMFFNEK